MQLGKWRFAGVQDKAEAMAAHIYGCRIIQRLLESETRSRDPTKAISSATPRHCTPKRLEKMLQQILRRCSAELKVVTLIVLIPALFRNVQHLRHHQTVHGSIRQLCDGL